MQLLLLDESFAVSHSKRGILGMANKGPHSNGSQFYITLQPTPWMDRTYVAFGFVTLIPLQRHLFKFPILHNHIFLLRFCWNVIFLFSFLVKWWRVSTSSGDWKRLRLATKDQNMNVKLQIVECFQIFLQCVLCNKVITKYTYHMTYICIHTSAKKYVVCL